MAYATDTDDALARVLAGSGELGRSTPRQPLRRSMPAVRGSSLRPCAPHCRLAPHATELLFAAGAGDRVVGVLSPANWPPEAARLPKVGDASAVSLEGILALQPT